MRPSPRAPVINRTNRPKVAVGTLAIFALSAMLFASNASAAGHLPAPIIRGLIRVNGSLQLGIEEAPAALIKDLGASSTACSSALGFEQSGDVVQANWTTLTGIVEGGDRPASRAVIGALARSRSYLADLRALFPDSWRDRAKVNKLILTVAQMQTGIRLLQVAVRSLGVAFERWEQHDCTGAQEAIAAANLRIHTAVGAINHGIERMALELRASEAAVDPILATGNSAGRSQPY